MLFSTFVPLLAGIEENIDEEGMICSLAYKYLVMANEISFVTNT